MMKLLQLPHKSNLSILQIPQKSTVKIAYLIMVHRLSKQFKRLFRGIYHPDNTYLINIDKKADLLTKQQIWSFLSTYPGIHILENQTVVWGGSSMVQAELTGMKYLLKLEKRWDYFINLSGQDYPLKSQHIISSFLTVNNGISFLKFDDQVKTRPETLNRIENYFSEKNGSISVETHKRNYMQGITPYIGGQWMILTKECCAFLCNNK